MEEFFAYEEVGLHNNGFILQNHKEKVDVEVEVVYDIDVWKHWQDEKGGEG